VSGDYFGKDTHPGESTHVQRLTEHVRYLLEYVRYLFDYYLGGQR
jgi:hypothetical protein